MHEILDTLEEINLDTLEYGFLSEDVDKYASEFKVYIPKVMGAIEFKETAHWQEQVDARIFVNDVGCAIKPTPKIMCQNFKTVRNHATTMPNLQSVGPTSIIIDNIKITVDEHSSISVSKQPVSIKKGTKLIIQSMNGNINDLYVHKII